MPRHARLDVPGTLHQVMVRGIEGCKIFQDEEDRQAFAERIRTLVRETKGKNELLRRGILPGNDAEDAEDFEIRPRR